MNVVGLGAKTENIVMAETVSREESNRRFTERISNKTESEQASFQKAMTNPGFIGIDDIRNIYMPMGFSNFKIEGRSLGSALEF